MIRTYEARTGQKLSYAQLAERSGIARATIESLASRSGCNPTLDTIDKLCGALECRLTDLIHYESTAIKQTRGKRSSNRSNRG